MTEEELQALEEMWPLAQDGDWDSQWEMARSVPALIAEIRRLQGQEGSAEPE